MGFLKRQHTSAATPDVELAPPQQASLDALRADGIAVTSFAELIGDDSLWRELSADMSGFVERALRRSPKNLTSPSRKDEFLIRRYRPGKGETADEAEEPRFRADSPWLRLMLGSGVIDLVNAYRGQRTRLVDLDHWYTVPYPEAGGRVASQRWHRDPEDQHVVKIFVYFSDVDDGSGPFQYVPGSAKGGRYGDLWEWGKDDWYPPQDEFERRIPADEQRSYSGPAGTIIVCDTSGFHRGGFAEERPRVLSYHTFVSPGSKQERTFTVVGSPAEAGLTGAALDALR